MRVTTVLVVVLALASSASQATAQHENGLTVAGDITYTGLDALPWHTSVHVYIEDMTSKSDVVAQKTILTEGEQIPIDFSLVIPRTAIQSGHNYAVCADISILEKSKFVCDVPVPLHLKKPVSRVKLSLRRLP